MYTHWINCINDSKTINSRHGLIPELINKSALKEMFPPLSAIADHFKAKDKTKTKQAYNDVAQHFVSSGRAALLGTQSGRVFMKQSFYNKPTSILVYLKLFHAWALNKLHPKHKGTQPS